MDVKRLRAELLVKGYTLKKYANFLGINVVTLHRKLSGDSDFKRNEIIKSREIFGTELTEMIFFAH